MTRTTSTARRSKRKILLSAPFLRIFTIFPAFLSILTSVFCNNELRIEDASGLIAFSNAVNSGTTYEGATVFLNSDVEFTDELSSQFNAIYHFRGTFDGQGHVIRNLAISASYQAAGLFGYSTGTTIQNVVIDKTCSFTNNYAPSESYGVYAGGIIGICQADASSCILENNVNMASVTFNGETSSSSLTGGVAALFVSTNYEATIKNCANYGAISNTGTSGENPCIGGIVGSPKGSSSSYAYVQNCANYGTVSFRGTTNYYVLIGGVSGYNKYANIDNCISFGSVIYSSSSGTKYIGSIIGYDYLSTIITHCYWSKSIEYDACGVKDSLAVSDSYSFNPSTFELARSVSIGNYAGTSLIGALNGAADYYTLRDYSHWALNKDSRDVSFTVNKTKLSFTTSTQVILLPDLAGGGNMTFSGWYTDSACEDLFTDFIIDSDEKKDLYGLLTVDENNYTINFNTRGGSAISSITSPYGSTVELPTSATRYGFKFLNWENEYGDPVITTSFTVPSRNVTLYAVWLCERITTARDLITFSKAVNSGTNFIGTTVYLDSDIDFTDDLSHQFEVIGNSGSYFRGTFNGQGHVIRNLEIASSSDQVVGLFGYTTGTIIQDVVIDETCSFTNNYYSDGSQAFTGGIIGYCKTGDGSCTLENNVNMADITFNGNTGKDSYMGSIVGVLVLMNYEGTIKNCANYGTILNSGVSEEGATIGGIASSLQGSSSSYYAYVQNCANYGTVYYKGATSYGAYAGGISGNSIYSTIENCISSGSIVGSPISGYAYAGSIVGYASTSTAITHCYWTSDVGCNDIIGPLSDSVKIISTIYVERLNTTTLGGLNVYVTTYKQKGFNQWVMLRLNGGSVSNLNQSDLVVAQKHFPSPVKEGNTFLCWCKDLECGEVYDNDLTGVTTLYAVWETVRVAFTFLNGTTGGAVDVKYGTEYGATLEAVAVVEGYTFCGWFISNDDDERIVTPDTIVTTISDHTLHGRWVANNYTVTLDLGNGTVITRILQYNETIELPQIIEVEGYTHTEWNNSNENMPAKNITISVSWAKNNYAVTLNLGNGTNIVKTFQYDETVELPLDIEREGCTHIGWDNDNTFKMPAKNVTINALWSKNNYTVTLDFGNGTVITKVLQYNETIELPQIIEVEGYTHTEWNNSNENMPAKNITISVSWAKNNYAVILDLGNGTVITKTFQYDETVELPLDIEREGCTHIGWDNDNTFKMPAKNVTINALWNCTRHSYPSSSSEPIIHDGGSGKSKSSSNTGAVVGGVVGGLVGVILIILAVLVLLLFFKKKGNKTEQKNGGIEMERLNTRIVEKSLNVSESGYSSIDNTVSPSVINDSLLKVYPVPYRVPTIVEALYMAGLSDNNIRIAVEECTNTGNSAANEGKLFDGFGKEDAAAVALYTFDFGGTEYESNPYRIINKALISRNNEELKKASGLLYLVLSAMRKLPKCTGKVLYRGVRGGADAEVYKNGNIIAWHGFSSTSPDMNATKAFLANNTASGNAEGTLFIIYNGWGYDIQPYSLFPDEAEILLEPERRFKVQSVIKAELTIINLEMIDTPVILPEVFGERSM